MSHTALPGNGGKKIKPPPPPPESDPLSSTHGTRSPPYNKYLPQQDTLVRPHVYPASNDSRGQAHSYQALMSGNDAVATEGSFRIAKRFFLNQRVNVNIEGCGWLLGIVVFMAKAVQSLTGSTVRVRYSIPTECKERESEFPNHPDYIRPL